MIRPLDRQAFRGGKPNTRWNAPVTALCDAAQMGLNSGQVKANPAKAYNRLTARLTARARITVLNSQATML